MRRILIVLIVAFVGIVAFDRLAPHTAARTGISLERMRAGLEFRRLAIPGFDIAYLEGGTGEPLLLVHGFGADKDNFTRVAAQLTASHRVIIPDLPGFGDSSRVEGTGYSIAEQVERLRAIAQALGLGRMHLGGSSMGGFIVSAYAAKYPEEVTSLWLLGPAGTGAALDSELGRLIRESGSNPLLVSQPQDFAATYAFVMSRPPFMPYSVKRVLAERAAADHALHARIFTEIGSPTSPLLESYVGRIDTPALIVWGLEDRALSPLGARALQALMPKAQVVLLDGIGHLPMIEAPTRTAQDWLQFVAALAR